MVHRDLTGSGKVVGWRTARNRHLRRYVLSVPSFILLPTKDRTDVRSWVMAPEFWWKVGQQVDQGPGCYGVGLWSWQITLLCTLVTS